MRPTLLIRLHEDPERCAWLILSDDGPPTPHRGPLTDIDAATLGQVRDVRVLVPTGRLLLTTARIPSRQRQQILQALPYALEERLIDDVEGLHFAIGPRDAAGLIPTAVVDRACMDDWLACLHAARIEPGLMAPDVLALPLPGSGQWSLCLDDGLALFRTGPYTGFVCDRQNLPVVLAAIAEDERPAELILHRCSDDVNEDLPPLAVPIEVVDHDTPLLALLGEGLRTTPSIDLLQGGYSRNRQIEELWQYARPTIVLVVLLLVVVFAGRLVEAHRLGQERERLATAVEALYRATFPEDKRIVNLRAQAERHLAALRKSTGASDGPAFFTLMGRAAPILAQTPGITIQRLTFRNGVLSLRLTLPSLAAVETLKDRLGSAKATSVRILSATSDKGRVTTSLELREARAS